MFRVLGSRVFRQFSCKGFTKGFGDVIRDLMNGLILSGCVLRRVSHL